MKTCIVTGGCGFIGARLVHHLLETTDWNVVVFDKMTYAAHEGKRLLDVRFNPRLSLHDTDISFMPFPLDVNPHYIAHLAAETHVDNSILNPGPFVESNIVGTYRMLQYARGQESLEKFLMFSTDEVFGPADGATFTEWSRHNPTNPYSATKSAGEQLALAWANTYGLPVVISHCCNVFGELQHEEKFIPKVVKGIKKGTGVTIHADKDGKPGSRMYVYAGDVARAIMLMLEHGAIREKYNIPGREVSNWDMVVKIAEIMGKPFCGRVSYPYKERPGWDFRYDISGDRLRQLGWEPTENFDALLKKVVESYSL